MPSPVKLNQDTLVPAGTALALAGLFLRGWMWVGAELRRIDSLEQQIAAVHEREEKNRWTCRDHERFTLELQLKNPKLVMPPMQKVCEP